MAIRKITCIILIMMFGISLFASGAFARVTCDGEQCKHHIMEGAPLTSMAKTILEDAGCCAGAERNPCDLEKGQALELHDFAISHVRVDKSNPSTVYVIGSNHVPEALSFMTLGPYLKDGVTVLSLPIYLGNMSLIC